MEDLARAANERRRHCSDKVVGVRNFIKLGKNVDGQSIRVFLNGEQITSCPICKKTWRIREPKSRLQFMCSFNHQPGRKTVRTSNELIVSWRRKGHRTRYTRRIFLISNRCHKRTNALKTQIKLVESDQAHP